MRIARAASTLAIAIIAVAGMTRAEAARRIPDATPITARTLVKLRLDLVINSQPAGRVVTVHQRGRHLSIQARDLRQAGVPLDADRHGWLGQAALAPIRLVYDRPRQRVNVVVPPEMLPRQMLDAQRRKAGQPAASPGALFNYDVYVNHNDAGDTFTSLGNELRLFGGWGSFDSTGQLQHGSARFGGGTTTRYIRYDTTLQRYDTDSLQRHAFGDVITGALPWSNAVRLGGVQWSKNFSIRPDLVTYPLPQFSGAAAVPSTVDLFIDGNRRRSENIAPGPFTLTDVPYINGAGQAVVVTRDTQGQRVAQTIPFYVSSDLLKPGLTDFSVSAGALREHYGQRSFDYDRAAASGVFRRGITRTFTLESHAEAAAGLALTGLGGVLRLGRLGVLNLAGAASQHAGETGLEGAVGYQYTRRLFNIGARHIERGRRYTDISGLADRAFRQNRAITQVTAGIDAAFAGTFNAAYFDTRTYTGDRSRLLNLSWNRTLPGNSNLLVSANRRLDGGDWSVLAQLVVPLGRRLTGRSEISREPGGHWRQGATLDRSRPIDGGLGYHLAYQHADAGSRPHYVQGQVDWRGGAFESDAGVYGAPGHLSYYGDLRGSIVAMDHQLMWSDRIDRSFILVDTDGQADVPITYENSRIGHTNGNGFALVPYVTPWYRASVGIDTLDLPPDIQTERVDRHVTVRDGAGARVHFTMRHVSSATLALQDAHGQPIPVGSRARLSGHGTSRLIGYDGLAYFPNLRHDARLHVRTPEGRRCTVAIHVPEHHRPGARLGPFTCASADAPGAAR